MESFDSGPLPELYNVIYATMYTNISLKEHGYAKIESNNIATKIWSIALDWESLISRQKNAKQAMLGFTVHRLTGSKEAAQNLHRLGHSISYNDILKHNEFWSHDQPPCRKIFSNSVALHSSIDNNDGRRETITGAGTTHDTNRTLYQPLLPGIANCMSFCHDNSKLKNKHYVESEKSSHITLRYDIEIFIISRSRNQIHAQKRHQRTPDGSLMEWPYFVA